MNVNDYLIGQKEMYKDRHFSEAVWKKRYEKAFDVFGTTKKQDSLDDILADKKEECLLDDSGMSILDNSFEYDFDLVEDESYYEEDLGFER